MLTDDHKTKQMGSALKFLMRYARKEMSFWTPLWLAPGDFHLFLHLQKHLAGESFDDDDEVQEEVMTWFKGQAADFYDSGIQKLVPTLNVWTMPATMLKNNVQAIHSQFRFCKWKMLYLLRHLYLYFPDTPRTFIIKTSHSKSRCVCVCV